MASRLQIVLDDLKSKGARLTKLRKALLELFHSQQTPLTVPEVLEQLSKQNLRVNKTSVYREVTFLLAEKVIHEISVLDGVKRYELFDESSHHHHVVCTKCKRVECVEIPFDLKALLRSMRGGREFSITSHLLELSGLCRKCR